MSTFGGEPEEPRPQDEGAQPRAAGRLDAQALEDPAEDLFYTAWISLLDATDYAIDGARSYGRRESQEAMLWAALSAEGRINAFLMGVSTLDAKDVTALVRLSVPERYAIGPRLALGQNLFPRDREPWSTLERMRKIRNGLVHPKPFGIELDPDAHDYDYDPLYAEFNPGTAAPIVIAVATATCTLADAVDFGADVDVERAVLAVAPRMLDIARRHSGPAPKGGYFERKELATGEADLIIELGAIVARAAGRD